MTSLKVETNCYSQLLQRFELPLSYFCPGAATETGSFSTAFLGVAFSREGKVSFSHT